MIKKISLLTLTFISFLFVGMMLPSVHAAGETVALTLNVVKLDESNEVQILPTTFDIQFGQTASLDLSGLEFDDDKIALLHNDTFVANNQEFLLSGSLNVSVIIKNDASDVVAAFVDTNGELIDVKYSEAAFTPSTVGMSSPSKPGYEFDGYDVSQITEDTVFVANYVRSSTTQINVNVVGGTKDKEEYLFNDIVTVDTNLPEFTHWEDEDGNVVSYKQSFKFSALEDITLTAKTDGTEQPIVYMRDVSGIRSGHKSYLGYVEFNENDFTLIEYGFLGGLADGVMLMEEIQYIPSTSIVNNEFLRSFTDSSTLYNTTAYAKLRNNVDSSITTIYSNGLQEYNITFNVDAPNDTDDMIYLVGNFSSRFWSPDNGIEIIKENDIYQLELSVLAKVGDQLKFKVLEKTSYDFEANYTEQDNSDRMYVFTSQKEDVINVTVSSWRGIVEIYLENHANWDGTFRIHVWGSNIINLTDDRDWPNNLPILELISNDPDTYMFKIKLYDARNLEDINILFRQTGTEHGQSQNLLYDSTTGNYYQLTGWDEGWVFVISTYPER